MLEVGAGEGALTGRLAPAVARVHAIELDERLRAGLEQLAAELGNVEPAFGDAMRIDLAALDPAPTAVVSNLPYSIATPLLLRTIAELPVVTAWTVMVQREIADRLRAEPGSRTYGAPSVTRAARLLGASCGARSTPRSSGRARGSTRRCCGSSARARAPAPEVVRLVRGAFAHRRKTLAGSLELAGEADRGAVREALGGARARP